MIHRDQLPQIVATLMSGALASPNFQPPPRGDFYDAICEYIKIAECIVEKCCGLPEYRDLQERLRISEREAQFCREQWTIAQKAHDNAVAERDAALEQLAEARAELAKAKDELLDRLRDRRGKR